MMCSALTAYSEICRKVRDWIVNLSIFKRIRSVILGVNSKKSTRQFWPQEITEIILFIQ